MTSDRSIIYNPPICISREVKSQIRFNFIYNFTMISLRNCPHPDDEIFLYEISFEFIHQSNSINHLLCPGDCRLSCPEARQCCRGNFVPQRWSQWGGFGWGAGAIARQLPLRSCWGWDVGAQPDHRSAKPPGLCTEGFHEGLHLCYLVLNVILILSSAFIIIIIIVIIFTIWLSIKSSLASRIWPLSRQLWGSCFTPTNWNYPKWVYDMYNKGIGLTFLFSF